MVWTNSMLIKSLIRQHYIIRTCTTGQHNSSGDADFPMWSLYLVIKLKLVLKNLIHFAWGYVLTSLVNSGISDIIALLNVKSLPSLKEIWIASSQRFSVPYQYENIWVFLVRKMMHNEKGFDNNRRRANLNKRSLWILKFAVEHEHI